MVAKLSSSLSNSRSLESHIVTLFEKLDSLPHTSQAKLSFREEIRTLEFWRAIIGECLATFFLVFLVCGAHIPWTTLNGGPVTISIATGVSVATIIQSFSQISGSHINPAVTVAFMVIKKISPIRGALYVTAQCGGAIAGAALLYGVTATGHQGLLGVTVMSKEMSSVQAFGMEYVLTFILMFAICQINDPHRKAICTPSICIGLAYMACTFVSVSGSGGSLNPARSLGPAFVMYKWDSHWVYWIGPILGSLSAALIYEFIFNSNRHGRLGKGSIDGDSSSLRSDDPYDDIDKTTSTTKFSTFNTLRSQHYDQYRPTQPTTANRLNQQAQHNFFISAHYNSQNEEAKRAADPIYEGSKSLYCRSPASPTLLRANLNRSESVYCRIPLTNDNTYGIRPVRSSAANRSQTLYNTKQNSRQESVYSTRPVPPIPSMPKKDSIYGTRLARADGIYGGLVTPGDSARLNSPRNDSVFGINSTSLQEPIYQTRNEALYGINRQECPNPYETLRTTPNKDGSQDSGYGNYGTKYPKSVSMGNGTLLSRKSSSPTPNSTVSPHFSPVESHY